MLKQNLPDIMIFKLPSGEEFICTIDTIEDNEFHIKNPLTLGMGDKGLQFMPISIMADSKKTMRVPRSQVILAYPSKDIEEKYKKALSPIMVPEKTIIT